MKLLWFSPYNSTLMDSISKKPRIVTHADFLLEIQHGLTINLTHINSHYEN
jgi:hypothetical protein